MSMNPYGLSPAQQLMLNNLLEGLKDPEHKYHTQCMAVLAEAVYQYDSLDCDASDALQASGFFGELSTKAKKPNTMKLV